MELKKEIFGVWILFTVRGRLDAQTAPKLDKELLPEIEKRLDIVLDFSELEYISSMGIRSIMQAIKKTYELNHRVAICGMRPPQSRKYFPLSALMHSWMSMTISRIFPLHLISMRHGKADLLFAAVGLK